MSANAPDTDAIAAKAVELVQPDTVVGLGTGRAATAFIQALGAKVQAGLRIRGLPTSEVSAELATKLGIPLVTFDDVPYIDVCVDGADEVDPNGDLIKGYGGALVREKVVAAYARTFVVLAGGEKVVKVLGERGKLPVEVVTFALTPCRKRLEALGFPSALRMKDGKPFVTDNGNYILDCRTTAITAPADTEAQILAIPGVVGTGIFAKMAHTIMIQGTDGSVEVRAGSAK
ncbi:ribose-5-phosphate isomerase RpiA [Gemmata sp. JC717]|uniref:ribose-5-phosphate isomerase RpiA n=1 Tax=Gemmata algarum TaxID=2975278 RepID=UPI0021BBA0D8|nr:ribose-5-phosphate isomerase RpiA [Gemmata algarum]MDY3557076.1 ribose-5-phosphate isomerase RpiA [Gemmata algarum]